LSSICTAYAAALGAGPSPTGAEGRFVPAVIIRGWPSICTAYACVRRRLHARGGRWCGGNDFYPERRENVRVKSAVGLFRRERFPGACLLCAKELGTYVRRVRIWLVLFCFLTDRHTKTREKTRTVYIRGIKTVGSVRSGVHESGLAGYVGSKVGRKAVLCIASKASFVMLLFQHDWKK
ncbi:hypothetical protein BaRGS_00023567, partial [Batillaria attramentaria]